MEVITVQYLINGLLTVSFIVIGFLLRRKDEDQQTEIDVIRKSVIKATDTISDLPKEYVLKEDYKEDIRELRDILTRIEEKIDKKADRVYHTPS